MILDLGKRDRVLPNTRLNVIVTAAGLVSLGVYTLLQVYAPPRRLAYSDEMLDAVGKEHEEIKTAIRLAQKFVAEAEGQSS